MLNDIIEKCKKTGSSVKEVEQGFRKLKYCGMILYGNIPVGFECEYLKGMFTYHNKEDLPRIMQVYQCTRK